MYIAFYIIAYICHLVSFSNYVRGRDARGYRFLLAGLGAQTATLVARGFLIGYAPLYGLYDFLFFTCWAAVGLAALTGLAKIARRWTPLFALAVIGILVFLNPGVRELPETFRTVFFPLHVGAVGTAYGAFLISFIAAALVLRQGGGSATTLNDDPARVMFRAIVIGQVLLTLGILLGAFWAKGAWGRYWSWDPKETAALGSWLIYTFWLAAWRGLKDKRRLSAGLAILGFLTILFTWFGVRFIGESLHSY